MDYSKLDFDSIQYLLRRNQITCRQVTEYYLKKTNEGKHLNAFISILEERALTRANEIDQKLAQSSAGKLAGLIIAIKDNINIKGERTTCGSKILFQFYISLQCDGYPGIRASRCHHYRQNQYGRICHGLVQ